MDKGYRRVITCILFFRNNPNIDKIRLSGIDTPEMKPLSGTENIKWIKCRNTYCSNYIRM